LNTYQPFSEIGRVFEYRGKEYHRGPESSAFEFDSFKMKLLDGRTRILKPYHRNGDNSYSVDIFTSYDDCVLMIETILKDQEYIETLEKQIKSLTDLLRESK
jgi:hypothetical protein